MKKLISKITNCILALIGLRVIRIKKNVEIEENHDMSDILNLGKEIIEKISPDYIVLNGPFKGLKYPSIKITEATLVPKILGSYEKQLWPVINDIPNKKYDNIIDIGCAEGYYAVGLSKISPQSIIHCYDINNADLDFCKEMAQLNNISNIKYNNFCDPSSLIEFCYGKRSFIICDCEGYELELFIPEVINKLLKTDILVELHDVINPVISKEIIQRFKASHDVRIINNIDVTYSDLTGLDILNSKERYFATYEHRGGLNQNIFMEWAYFTCK